MNTTPEPGNTTPEPGTTQTPQQQLTKDLISSATQCLVAVNQVLDNVRAVLITGSDPLPIDLVHSAQMRVLDATEDLRRLL